MPHPYPPLWHRRDKPGIDGGARVPLVRQQCSTLRWLGDDQQASGVSLGRSKGADLDGMHFGCDRAPTRGPAYLLTDWLGRYLPYLGLRSRFAVRSAPTAGKISQRRSISNTRSTASCHPVR